ncbi:putative glutathione S-transferase [Izhakiella capsodis]|uniref:Putative glutathione S-transferase n=1 Tax=Izhakiella capsodis TaxID=1367852 RepID=A0A1I4XC59_9GAMM|nr:putative glutathione S-transferase [Izhakiella capsodis]
MGQLINGVWHDGGYDTKTNGGHFKRIESVLRHWITSNGAEGPSAIGGFKTEKDRSHLYVALACPWAHRTLLMHRLKGLEKLIDISVVRP